MTVSAWRPSGEPAIEGLAMEVIEHEGHTITFDVAHRGKGWTWTYPDRLEARDSPTMATACR